jgi:hypothetical protein
MIGSSVFSMSSRVISQRESFRGRLELVTFCGDLARPSLDRDVFSVNCYDYNCEGRNYSTVFSCSAYGES